MYSEADIYAISFENEFKIQNQYLDTKYEINDDPKLKNEFDFIGLKIKFGIEKILSSNIKNSNIDLNIKSIRDYKNWKIDFYINQKPIIQNSKVKSNTQITSKDADIPFDKIERLDLHIYSQQYPNKILCKYAVLFSPFEKIKLNISNIYKYNSIIFPYYTAICFSKEEKTQIYYSEAVFKIKWNDLFYDKFTKSIAEIIFFVRQKESVIDKDQNKSQKGLFKFKADNFTFLPFVKTKIPLLKELKNSDNSKQIFDLVLNSNFEANLTQDDLILTKDITVIKGLQVPKRFTGNMQTALILNTDFFEAQVARNFKNSINWTDANYIPKNKELKIEEIKPIIQNSYRFSFDMSKYQEIITKSDWQFSWFLKK
ncbi:hypothetical protein [Mycoplasma buteonis]|uniref:hypothetical protein n=1 Tax=Mycoplasma buteonis TaxID=171280 RepID=UPI000566F638|nr:hypothetical protein [Mycoplasma buteonis]